MASQYTTWMVGHFVWNQLVGKNTIRPKLDWDWISGLHLEISLTDAWTQGAFRPWGFSMHFVVASQKTGRPKTLREKAFFNVIWSCWWLPCWSGEVRSPKKISARLLPPDIFQTLVLGNGPRHYKTTNRQICAIGGGWTDQPMSQKCVQVKLGTSYFPMYIGVNIQKNLNPLRKMGQTCWCLVFMQFPKRKLIFKTFKIKHLDLARWILIIQSSSIALVALIAKNRAQSQVKWHLLYPEFVEGDTLGYSPFSACQEGKMKVSVWIPLLEMLTVTGWSMFCPPGKVGPHFTLLELLPALDRQNIRPPFHEPEKAHSTWFFWKKFCPTPFHPTCTRRSMLFNLTAQTLQRGRYIL